MADDRQAYRFVSAGPDGTLGRNALSIGARVDETSDDLIYENGSFLLPRE